MAFFCQTLRRPSIEEKAHFVDVVTCLDAKPGATAAKDISRIKGDVVAKGHRVYIPAQVVFDGRIGNLDLKYEVLSTTPEGEVTITEKTNLVVRIKFRD